MFEKFKPANDNQEKVEKLDAWRDQKESAPEKAVELLTAQGLEVDFENASAEELQKIIAELPALMEGLSVAEDGTVQNENRYLVRELSVFLNKVEAKLTYEQAPSPALANAT